MIEYKAMEMHSHTLHSDGTFTVEGLCRAAKAKELDGLALTDHNTFSGYEEVTPALVAETLPVVRGIEWTTFYGHMLVIGAEEYVDWRLATPDNIDEYTAAIHAVNGAVGIAHPFSLGSPFCTGGYWDFRVQNWQNIDYIEIWSEHFPLLNPINELAMQWWTDLLNRGHRLAVTNGRDWHGPDGEKKVHMAVTCLGVEDGVVNTKTVREALQAGRSFVSCGPGLALHATQNGARRGLGEEVSAGDATVDYAMDPTLRRSQWDGFGIRPRNLQVVLNGAPAATIPCEDAPIEGSLNLNLWPGWLRLEVWGDYMDREDQLLGFTSPIYVQ